MSDGRQQNLLVDPDRCGGHNKGDTCSVWLAHAVNSVIADEAMDGRGDKKKGKLSCYFYMNISEVIYSADSLFKVHTVVDKRGWRGIEPLS